MSKRFFIREHFSEGILVSLEDAEYASELKHMIKVMRLKKGDKLLLTNDQGQEASAQIEALSKSSATLKILSVKTIQKLGPSLLLAQAILKGPKMDWLVEKITELGVEEFQPCTTEFTVAAPQEGEGRIGRWQRIAEAALKQSGSGTLPQIYPAQELEKFATPPNTEEWRLVLHIDGETEILWAALNAKKEASPLPKKIVLCIGPEGGFSEDELKQLKQKGFQSVSLGHSILRGETAGIVAISIARHWIDFQR